MVKGWHVCKASMAFSISARCFAKGLGTSNRGDDANVPSRLKEIRIFDTEFVVRVDALRLLRTSAHTLPERRGPVSTKYVGYLSARTMNSAANAQRCVHQYGEIALTIADLKP